MKALSLKQPYAELIRNGSKIIETRKWKTNYRGDLLICSSLSKHDGGVKYKDFVQSMKLLDYYAKNNIEINYGYAICVVKLVDVKPMKKEDEKSACCSLYDGAYSWFLEDLRQIEQFPVKGQLSLFDVYDKLIIFK